jgi:hypothetical protein
VKQGRVYTIAKKFDTMQDIPKQERKSYQPGVKHNNTTLFRQMPEKTEGFSTLASLEMALQSGRAARPMAELEHGQVTSGEAARPTTALKPSLKENQVEGSHIGKSGEIIFNWK